MFYVFTACFIVFLIWGIAFLIRGLKDSEIEKTAVPISDLKEIREIKEPFIHSTHHAAPGVVPEVKGPMVLEHSLKEDLSQKWQQAQERIETLTRENKHLALALE